MEGMMTEVEVGQLSYRRGSTLAKTESKLYDVRCPSV